MWLGICSLVQYIRTMKEKPRTGRPRKVTNDQSAWALREIELLGRTTQSVAQELGVDASTLRDRIIADCGRPPRYSRRTYRLNEDAFNTSKWSAEDSYWLGMLYADGTCSGNKTSLGLKTEDGYLVDQFSEHIQYSGPKRVKYPYSSVAPNGRRSTSTGFFSVTVSSVELAKRLQSMGIRVNDKAIYSVPSHTEAYLRGMFDGNGSVVGCRSGVVKGLMFCGKLEGVEFFRSTLLSIDPSLRISVPVRDRTIFKVHCSSVEDTVRILKVLYSGQGPRMKRKAKFADYRS